MKRTHGTGVAQALGGSFLPTKVGKGIETVRVVETFLVFSMAAFHLSIVPGSKWPDDFVADPMHFQVSLEESGLFPVRGKAVGKFRPIVCLDTFNRAGEGFYQMFHKLSGRIGAVFLKGFEIASKRAIRFA